MRAGLPVQPAGRRRRSRRSLSCFLPRRPRHKEEEPPVLLLRDMGLCYRLLERLVPALVPGIAASRLEILQHVIDYILELQTELDASCPAGEREESRVTGSSSSNSGHGAARAPLPAVHTFPPKTL
ncbi:DNA-binding protein inhibitor ID-2b [Amphiprion ocellaris]|uniref:DNA-binding protein inhibitor ID-2b n=1 Tax=Amphiprion ocellaris TaxID=80972 RepID=UPI000C3102A1|nr:DNA-binding protein inhibitor ID-2b [Amphiprion ocellaris]